MSLATCLEEVFSRLFGSEEEEEEYSVSIHNVPAAVHIHLSIHEIMDKCKDKI